MSTSITTSSITKEQINSTALLKQLKPLFTTQNDRISRIEYCMYGVNNHNWLNDRYNENIPVYMQLRQSVNKLTAVEKDLNEKFEGIQETANTAFSDTRGIDVTIGSKVQVELNKIKSGLSDDLAGVKAGFETRLGDDRKRLDLIERALEQLEKTPVVTPPAKISRPVTPDKLGETVSRNIQKKMITDECNRILSEIMPSYCKEKSVLDKFLNHGEYASKLAKRLDEAEKRNSDLEKRLISQENTVKAVLIHSGDAKMVQIMFVHDTIEKILVEISSMSDAWFFKDRVTEEQAPDYSKFVTSPICLADMKIKNSEFSYKQFDWFVHDFRLMIKNAKDYNFPSKNAETTKPLILRVEKIFDQKIKDLPPKIYAKPNQQIQSHNSPNQQTFGMLPTPKMVALPSTATSSAVLTNILSNSNCTKVGPTVQISQEEAIQTEKTPQKRPVINRGDQEIKSIRESISVLDGNQNKIFNILGIPKSEVSEAVTSPPEKKSKMTPPPSIPQAHLQPISASVKSSKNSDGVANEPKSIPLVKGFSRLKGAVEMLMTNNKISTQRTEKLEEQYNVLYKHQQAAAQKTDDLNQCFSSLDNQQKAVSDKIEENINDLKLLIDKNKTESVQVLGQKTENLQKMIIVTRETITKGVNQIRENVNLQTHKCSALENMMNEQLGKAKLPEIEADVKTLKENLVTAFTEVDQKTKIMWALPLLQSHIHHASQPQQVQAIQNHNSQNQFIPPPYLPPIHNHQQHNHQQQQARQPYNQTNIPAAFRNTTGSPHFAGGSPQTNNSPKNTPQK